MTLVAQLKKKLFSKRQEDCSSFPNPNGLEKHIHCKMQQVKYYNCIKGNLKHDKILINVHYRLNY